MLARLLSDAQNLIDAELADAAAPCVTSSFQLDGVVLVHLLRTRRPTIPVVFLDTLHHFADTYAYRDELTKRWGLNLLTLRAADPRVGEWQLDTDACCRRHKVEPLFAALEAFDVWFAGLRREQSPSRAELGEVESFRLPSGTVLRKVSPLASWPAQAVAEYAAAHQIPRLPLYERGYTSIGCEPCTERPTDPSQPRSGRWHGQKLECGIHLQVVPGAGR